MTRHRANERKRLARALIVLRRLERLAEVPAQDDIYSASAHRLGKIQVLAAIEVADLALSPSRARRHTFGRLRRHNRVRVRSQDSAGDDCLEAAS